MVTESEMILTEVLGDIKGMKTKAEIVNHIKSIIDTLNPKTNREIYKEGDQDWVIYWFDNPKNTAVFIDNEDNGYRFGGEFIGCGSNDCIIDIAKDLDRAGIKVKRYGLAGYDRSDLILDTVLLDVENKTYELAVAISGLSPDSIGKLGNWISIWWD